MNDWPKTSKQPEAATFKPFIEVAGIVLIFDGKHLKIDKYLEND